MANKKKATSKTIGKKNGPGSAGPYAPHKKAVKGY